MDTSTYLFAVLLVFAGSIVVYQVVLALLSGKIRGFNRNQFLGGSEGGIITRQSQPFLYWFHILLYVSLALLLLVPILYGVSQKFLNHGTPR
jgi:hypothetical protein